MQTIKVIIITLKEILNLCIKNKNIILELAKREFGDRYVGQIFGMLWVIIHPLILMLVFMFIFVVVFKVKAQGLISITDDYATYLLSGLSAWLVIQEVLTKSSTMITSNANLIKQVVFPVEVLPIKTVTSSLLTMVLFILILLFYTAIIKQTYSYMLLFLPFLIYMQIIFMLGLAFMLSSIGVYVRDIKDVVQLFAFIGVFIMPVMYLPSQIPALFEPFIYTNPFSYLIFCYQDLFFYGNFAHWYAWVFMFVFSHSLLIFSYILFKRLKIMFGDVL